MVKFYFNFLNDRNLQRFSVQLSISPQKRIIKKYVSQAELQKYTLSACCHHMWVGSEYL